VEALAIGAEAEVEVRREVGEVVVEVCFRAFKYSPLHMRKLRAVEECMNHC
jgi:hypothetical protein